MAKTVKINAGYMFRFEGRLVRSTTAIELEVVPLKEVHYEMLTESERIQKANQTALLRMLRQPTTNAHEPEAPEGA